MRVSNGDLKGRLKVVLGFGAPNAYDVHGKKIRIKLLIVDMACSKEANKTENKVKKYESTNICVANYKEKVQDLW